MYLYSYLSQPDACLYRLSRTPALSRIACFSPHFRAHARRVVYICCCFPTSSARSTVKVILTDDITGTGYRGEYVEIRGGFMRNFLFPGKRAIYATHENTALYESVDRVRRAMCCFRCFSTHIGRNEGVCVPHRMGGEILCCLLSWVFRNREKLRRMVFCELWCREVTMYQTEEAELLAA